MFHSCTPYVVDSRIRMISGRIIEWRLFLVDRTHPQSNSEDHLRRQTFANDRLLGYVTQFRSEQAGRSSSLNFSPFVKPRTADYCLG